MKNQTAVEWLVNELIKKGLPIEKYGMDSYEQAQQMEKQQIEDAYAISGKPCSSCKKQMVAGPYPKWVCLRENCNEYLRAQN